MIFPAAALGGGNIQTSIITQNDRGHSPEVGQRFQQKHNFNSNLSILISYQFAIFGQTTLVCVQFCLTVIGTKSPSETNDAIPLRLLLAERSSLLAP